MGEGRTHKTYADYLRQGNNFNKAYLMPKEARPPFEQSIGEEIPSTSKQMARTTDDYIKLAEERERNLNSGLRSYVIREIEREIQLDLGVA